MKSIFEMLVELNVQIDDVMSMLMLNGATTRAACQAQGLSNAHIQHLIKENLGVFAPYRMSTPVMQPSTRLLTDLGHNLQTGDQTIAGILKCKNFFARHSGHYSTNCYKLSLSIDPGRHTGGL